MSDITLNPITVQIMAPSPEEAEHQEDPMLQLVIPTGAPLPTAQGIVPLQLDTYRIGLPRELSINLGNALLEAAEKLPEPKPTIDIAGSLNDEALRRAQDMERKFRGSDKPE